MEIKELINFLFGGIIALLGWFFRRELDKTSKDMEEIKKQVVFIEKKLEVNEQRDKATKELIETKLDNHRQLIEEKFNYLTNLIEKKL